MSTWKRPFHRTSVFLTNGLLSVLKLPRPLLFIGPGSSQQLCRTIAETGTRRLLVVTDAVLMKLGLVEPMLAALKGAGVECSVYDGVEPNPTYAQVEAGLALFDETRSEAVLSVGGGSPIDAAKVIVARASTRKPIEKLIGNFKIRGALLPHFAVPTTAGTGSEVTVAAIVTDTQARRKWAVADPKLVPQMAALDPDLMLGLPPAITAATGLDALTHAVEAYVSTIANAETDGFARAAVRLIFRHLRRAYDDGSDREARQGMALASTYAGLAFTRALVGYVHAIAHNFGGMYHTPHGLANAIILPHVLDYSAPAAASRLAELAAVVELGTKGEADRELAGRFIAEIRELNRHMQIPEGLDALRALDVPTIAERALAEAHGTYAVPRYMDQEQCETLVRGMLT